jgi:hypothetical protein
MKIINHGWHTDERREKRRNPEVSILKSHGLLISVFPQHAIGGEKCALLQNPE